MAHLTQRRFFEKVKTEFPNYFVNTKVIDFGSLDINGSLKGLFSNCNYIGVDIREGKNVDRVSKAHEYCSEKVDIVVSAEMLEHDAYWLESLLNMYELLKNGGLMAVSAAGPLRKEHGTLRTFRKGDIRAWGESPTYYRNITKEMMEEFIGKTLKRFSRYNIEYGWEGRDLYFYGIKQES